MINKAHKRRANPRVAGNPPTETYSAHAFKANFGDGRHGKEGVPKRTKVGYERASHHCDYFTDKNK